MILVSFVEVASRALRPATLGAGVVASTLKRSRMAGSGAAILRLLHSDDEAGHVLEGEPRFRYPGRAGTRRRSSFQSAPTPTPPRYPMAWQREIYRRFDSDPLE